MLKGLPAVWLVGEPTLPVPLVNVWPPKVIIILAAEPATSVRVPHSAAGSVRFFMMLVPAALVAMLPVAKGVAVVVLGVMVEPAPATVALKVLPLVMPLMFCDGVPALVTSTVTVTPALNRKPLGAFKMMVPRPMLPGLASAAMGLVKVVHVPPVLSAEMAEPPVAAVTVTN